MLPLRAPAAVRVTTAAGQSAAEGQSLTSILPVLAPENRPVNAAGA